MLKLHEVLGTDKFIFDGKEDNYFTMQDLLALGERPADYEIIGYLKVLKWGELFFKPLFSAII